MAEPLLLRNALLYFLQRALAGQRCQVTPYVVNVVLLLVVGGGAIAKMCYNLT